MKTTILAFLLLSVTCFSQDKIVVRVTGAGGEVIKDAKVAAILKSGACQEAKLEQDVYVCQPTEKCVKIFTGAPGYEGAITKYSGSAGEVSVALQPNAAKSSTVLFRKGRLPGIDGHIQPHLDNSNRTYMHGDKIGFEKNGRPAAQPVYFNLNKPVDAISPTGSKFKIWVLDLTDQASVVEFTLPK